MEIVLLLVALGIGAALLMQSQQKKRQQELAEPSRWRRSAGSPRRTSTRFGEDVTLLDNETAGRQLDEATRQDYRRALDAYDAAKAALDRVAEARRRPRASPASSRTAATRWPACRPGSPASRCPAAPATVLLQPAARPVQRERRLGTARWRAPLGARPARPTPSGSATGCRAGRAQGAGRRRPPARTGRAGRGYGPYAQGYFSPFAMSGLLPGLFLGSLLSGGFGGWRLYSDGDGRTAGRRRRRRWTAAATAATRW